VVFFYNGEEGTYVDDVHVTLYTNGIVNIESSYEQTTTHLQNCEILWEFTAQPEDRPSKIRLLKKPEATASLNPSKPVTDSPENDKPVN